VGGLVHGLGLRCCDGQPGHRRQRPPRALTGRLANPNAAGKAPPEVVADCRANPAEAEGQAELARGRLAELG
jgi:valyl-tRNA synthetase